MNSNETEKTLKEIRGKVPDAQTEAECGPKSLRQLVIKRTLAWTGNESGTLEININLLMSCPDVLRNPFFSSTLWYFSNQQLGASLLINQHLPMAICSIGKISSRPSCMHPDDTQLHDMFRRMVIEHPLFLADEMDDKVGLSS
ncbi:hypothetical protein DUI87_17183 [Hirundo rustica rustica]|uniref:Uncharacterized protein n=1 Tax=Hirundo rustica rustica TaxID=333673 RepID=A0A3M0K3G3_HIRRU|nr:hypothetical protein DUI87_17183 [Hirundo rustica rustica]